MRGALLRAALDLDPFTPSASALWTFASALLGLQIAVHAGHVVTLASTDLVGRIQVGGPAAAVVLLQALNVLGVGFDHGFGPYRSACSGT